jgi:hypothetical protein
MFSPKETQIYRFWNGEFDKEGKPIYAFCDPLEVQVRLETHDPNYQQSFKTLFDMVQISKNSDAAKEIVDLGRIMFDLKEPYDDPVLERVQGHTTFGVMSIVLEYISWMNDLKKSIEDTPTGVSVMEAQEEPLPTNVSLECG